MKRYGSPLTRNRRVVYRSEVSQRKVYNIVIPGLTRNPVF
jgi:hypothetical protein